MNRFSILKGIKYGFFSFIRDLCTKYKFSIKSDDFDV